MRSGLAKTTFKTYDSAWSSFSDFCYAFSVPILPVNISITCAFITHCFESRKLKPSTIKIMILGIQFHIRCIDPSSQSLLQNPSICLLNGLKKESPAVPDKRLPLSLSQVHTMVDKLRSGLFTPHTNLLLEAAFLTAYYGFLRGGEFTINTKKFDPSHDLTIKDISFHTEYFSIYLKHSKTDRDNNGSTINISRTNDGYCPLTAMNRLVSSRSKSNPTDPLFITEKGEAMSKHWFASRLRTACLHCGMDPALYTSHSFRIGAATTADSTVSIPMLKAMGRWSSSAYQRYIRPTTQDVLLAQKALSSSSI
ncbi:hypothetical protein DPX16_23141 [Anabarilius grahami]|uniref:Tyr recombinase domain-containing protein n=1 Tax=Anabarilius grahami TaxID=495550 RepID=A0A3N0XHR5_ANAGA|nr:hypothetical protein DPX16_23141 [Anabarilius grahami]